MEQLQRAVIMAAGEGNRMRPLTSVTPKPLISVNGVRMIDTGIHALKANGIHEIYIVAGYKKEQFYEAFKDDPEVTVIENPHYLDGNNITSMYAARAYLPGAFVLEGDMKVFNESIFDPHIERSGYLATWMEEAPEWALKVKDGRILNFTIAGRPDSHRLWGVSMWTEADGRRLAKMIEEQFEVVKDWSVYWDEIALSRAGTDFDLGVREIGPDDIIEIDTVDELIAIDGSYREIVENMRKA